MDVTYIVNEEQLQQAIHETLTGVRVVDMHTHLFPMNYQELCLYGIDELLTYHYLVAEAMRQSAISFDDFWRLSKREQATLIWQTLFVDNSPISEATQGVITILEALGIDFSGKRLDDIREQFTLITSREDYVGRVMNVAQVETLVMTNDPFHSGERKYMGNVTADERFLHSLRLDTLVTNWSEAVKQLDLLGYTIGPKLTEESVLVIRNFLGEWVKRLSPVYFAVSLPPTFKYPENSHAADILDKVILPVCTEHKLPLAVMIGARRNVNPDLKLAGDAVGIASVEALGNLCAAHPENKFLVTLLSRENQYELAVMARKFRNMTVFGCWWFLNTPFFIDELSRMRFELLGTSFIPQHSDCRVLEQLIYKWRHTFVILEQILFEKYRSLLRRGWKLSATEIERDVNKLFRGNFLNISAKPS